MTNQQPQHDAHVKALKEFLLFMNWQEEEREENCLGWPGGLCEVTTQPTHEEYVARFNEYRREEDTHNHFMRTDEDYYWGHHGGTHGNTF